MYIVQSFCRFSHRCKHLHLLTDVSIKFHRIKILITESFHNDVARLFFKYAKLVEWKNEQFCQIYQYVHELVIGSVIRFMLSFTNYLAKLTSTSTWFMRNCYNDTWYRYIILLVPIAHHYHHTCHIIHFRLYFLHIQQLLFLISARIQCSISYNPFIYSVSLIFFIGH